MFMSQASLSESHIDDTGPGSTSIESSWNGDAHPLKDTTFLNVSLVFFLNDAKVRVIGPGETIRECYSWQCGPSFLLPRCVSLKHLLQPSFAIS